MLSRNLQGGYLERANGAGVRINAYACGGSGCNLIAVLRYSAYGVFCPSINNDRIVNPGDQAILANDMVNGLYNLEHDLNVDGRINPGDRP